jgi:hypothetical protein
MRCRYRIICTLTEYLQKTVVDLDSKDGWRFVESDTGYYLFENPGTGESQFYPVAMTLIHINKVAE